MEAPLDELIPVGPLKVRVRLPAEVTGKTARLLVSGGEKRVTADRGYGVIEVSSVTDHEVLVI